MTLARDFSGGTDAAAVTMDVFDTALTRCWARPQHTFLACAPRLRELGLTTLRDESWMQMRQRAERSAALRCGADMATLDDIYIELARESGWTRAGSAAARTIELEVERDSARSMPRTLAFCTRLAREGRPLRFLSDMYLPEHDVAQLLTRVGYRIEPEQVWVSAQRRASKSHGRLFVVALAAWQHLCASQVLHVGDNPVSDVQRARNAGLRALHVDDARLPRSAQRLLEVEEAPLQLRSLVAGAMRLAMLQAPTHAPGQDGLWQLGSCHAGPMLTLYVWWLLAHARQNKVKRLYFLARDGQVLLAIARVLQSVGVGSGIELRYLHASRQAWFAPSLTRWDETSLFRLLDEPDRLNDPAKLAKRLGFDDAAALRRLWPNLTDALTPDLDNRELAKLLVRTVPSEAGLAHTARVRRNALDYLHDQDLFDGVPWAIVDLGWRGRMQECLARIVQCHPVAVEVSAAGYYLGLIEAPRDMPAGWSALAFCSQDDVSRLPGPAHLLELFCEADHGSTQGYSRDAKGSVHAVFDAKLDSRLCSWGLGAYREAVLCYATQLAAALPLLNPTAATPAGMLALTRALGRDFFSRAEPAAARAFAQMPCSHSVNHDAVSDLAPTLGCLDAWCRALSLGRLRLSPQSTAWLPGSLARSDAAAYRVYALIHRLADKLRQRASAKR